MSKPDLFNTLLHNIEKTIDDNQVVLPCDPTRVAEAKIRKIKRLIEGFLQEGNGLDILRSEDMKRELLWHVINAAVKIENIKVDTLKNLYNNKALLSPYNIDGSSSAILTDDVIMGLFTLEDLNSIRDISEKEAEELDEEYAGDRDYPRYKQNFSLTYGTYLFIHKGRCVNNECRDGQNFNMDESQGPTHTVRQIAAILELIRNDKYNASLKPSPQTCEEYGALVGKNLSRLQLGGMAFKEGGLWQPGNGQPEYEELFANLENFINQLVYSHGINLDKNSAQDRDGTYIVFGNLKIYVQKVFDDTAQAETLVIKSANTMQNFLSHTPPQILAQIPDNEPVPNELIEILREVESISDLIEERIKNFIGNDRKQNFIEARYKFEHPDEQDFDKAKNAVYDRMIEIGDHLEDLLKEGIISESAYLSPSLSPELFTNLRAFLRNLTIGSDKGGLSVIINTENSVSVDGDNGQQSGSNNMTGDRYIKLGNILVPVYVHDGKIITICRGAPLKRVNDFPVLTSSLLFGLNSSITGLNQSRIDDLTKKVVLSKIAMPTHEAEEVNDREEVKHNEQERIKVVNLRALFASNDLNNEYLKRNSEYEDKLVEKLKEGNPLGPVSDNLSPDEFAENLVGIHSAIVALKRAVQETLRQYPNECSGPTFDLSKIVGLAFRPVFTTERVKFAEEVINFIPDYFLGKEAKEELRKIVLKPAHEKTDEDIKNEDVNEIKQILGFNGNKGSFGDELLKDVAESLIGIYQDNLPVDNHVEYLRDKFFELYQEEPYTRVQDGKRNIAPISIPGFNRMNLGLVLHQASQLGFIDSKVEKTAAEAVSAVPEKGPERLDAFLNHATVAQHLARGTDKWYATMQDNDPDKALAAGLLVLLIGAGGLEVTSPSGNEGEKVINASENNMPACSYLSGYMGRVYASFEEGNARSVRDWISGQRAGVIESRGSATHDVVVKGGVLKEKKLSRINALRIGAESLISDSPENRVHQGLNIAIGGRSKKFDDISDQEIGAGRSGGHIYVNFRKGAIGFGAELSSSTATVPFANPFIEKDNPLGKHSILGNSDIYSATEGSKFAVKLDISEKTVIAHLLRWIEERKSKLSNLIRELNKEIENLEKIVQEIEKTSSLSPEQEAQKAMLNARIAQLQAQKEPLDDQVTAQQKGQPGPLDELKNYLENKGLISRPKGEWMRKNADKDLPALCRALFGDEYIFEENGQHYIRTAFGRRCAEAGIAMPKNYNGLAIDFINNPERLAEIISYSGELPAEIIYYKPREGVEAFMAQRPVYANISEKPVLKQNPQFGYETSTAIGLFYNEARKYEHDKKTKVEKVLAAISSLDNKGFPIQDCRDSNCQFDATKQEDIARLRSYFGNDAEAIHIITGLHIIATHASIDTIPQLESEVPVVLERSFYSHSAQAGEQPEQERKVAPQINVGLPIIELLEPFSPTATEEGKPLKGDIMVFDDSHALVYDAPCLDDTNEFFAYHSSKAHQQSGGDNPRMRYRRSKETKQISSFRIQDPLLSSIFVEELESYKVQYKPFRFTLPIRQTDESIRTEISNNIAKHILYGDHSIELTSSEYIVQALQSSLFKLYILNKENERRIKAKVGIINRDSVGEINVVIADILGTASSTSSSEREAIEAWKKDQAGMLGITRGELLSEAISHMPKGLVRGAAKFGAFDLRDTLESISRQTSTHTTKLGDRPGINLHDKFNYDKSRLCESLEGYLNDPSRHPTTMNEQQLSDEAIWLREFIISQARGGNLIEAMKVLEELRDLKNGIITFKLPLANGKGLTPVIIRDARAASHKNIVFITESFEIQYLSLINAAIKVAGVVNGEHSFQEFIDKAVKFIEDSQSINTQESLSEKFLNASDEIVALLESKGIKDVREKLDFAGKFQAFDVTQRNVATISTVDTGNGEQTIIEADVMLRGLTREQKLEYERVSRASSANRPGWSTTKRWKNGLYREYAHKIGSGNYAIPDGLDVPGVKGAAEQLVFIWNETASTPLELQYSSRRCVAIDRFPSLTEEERKRLTTQNHRQIEQWVGQAVHYGTEINGKEEVPSGIDSIRKVAADNNSVYALIDQTVLSLRRILGNSFDLASEERQQLKKQIDAAKRGIKGSAESFEHREKIGIALLEGISQHIGDTYVRDEVKGYLQVHTSAIGKKVIYLIELFNWAQERAKKDGLSWTAKNRVNNEMNKLCNGIAKLCGQKFNNTRFLLDFDYKNDSITSFIDKLLGDTLPPEIKTYIKNNGETKKVLDAIFDSIPTALDPEKAEKEYQAMINSTGVSVITNVSETELSIAQHSNTVKQLGDTQKVKEALNASGHAAYQVGSVISARGQAGCYGFTNGDLFSPPAIANTLPLPAVSANTRGPILPSVARSVNAGERAVFIFDQKRNGKDFVKLTSSEYDSLRKKIQKWSGHSSIFSFSDTSLTIACHAPFDVLLRIERGAILDQILEVCDPSQRGLGVNIALTNFSVTKRDIKKNQADNKSKQAALFFTSQAQANIPDQSLSISPKAVEDVGTLMKQNFVLSVKKDFSKAAIKSFVGTLSSLNKDKHKVMFVESLAYHPTIQTMLNDYAVSSKDMPIGLKSYLKGVDRVEKGPIYTLVKTAKQNGIRIVGLDTDITHNARAFPNQRNKASTQLMNYEMREIIERETSSLGADEHWSAIVADTTMQRTGGCPNIADIMGSCHVKAIKNAEDDLIHFKDGRRTSEENEKHPEVTIPLKSSPDISIGDLKRTKREPKSSQTRPKKISEKSAAQSNPWLKIERNTMVDYVMLENRNSPAVVMSDGSVLRFNAKNRELWKVEEDQNGQLAFFMNLELIREKAKEEKKNRKPGTLNVRIHTAGGEAIPATACEVISAIPLLSYTRQRS